MRTETLIFLLLLSVQISLTIAKPKKSSKSNNIPKYFEPASLENSDRKTTIQENKPDLRIIHGNIAEKGQFPHHVYVFSLKGSVGMHCGGSLISTKFVLTVKRCTQYEDSSDFEKADISFGHNKASPVLKITTNKFISHPDVNLGLIDLGRDIELSDEIGIILLAKQSQTADQFTFQFATITGFGWIKEQDPNKVPDVLRYLRVLVTTVNTCKVRWGIHDYSLCSVGILYNEAPCIDDDGGALIVSENKINIQIGVLDGIKWECINGDVPNLYVAPQHFWSWINKNTGIPIRE